MSIAFQLEIDKETVAAFLEDVNDISQDIEVDISRLVDNKNFDYHLQNLLDKLDNLEIHANGSALFPIAESIEIISNILKNTRQHHAIINDAFIDIIYVMIDRITAMAENVIHEQSIPFEMFTLFQYLGMLLIKIDETNYKKEIKNAKHYISNTANIITTRTFKHDQDIELFGETDNNETVSKKIEKKPRINAADNRTNVIENKNKLLSAHLNPTQLCRTAATQYPPPSASEFNHGHHRELHRQTKPGFQLPNSSNTNCSSNWRKVFWQHQQKFFYSTIISWFKRTGGMPSRRKSTQSSHFTAWFWHVDHVE